MENQNTPEQTTLDLVLPVGAGGSWRDELRYVLRSYCKNFKHLGKVFIVGDVKKIKAKYPYLKGVEFVECNDPFNHNKDANIIRKVIKVIDTCELSDPFIRASDDQFVLRKVDSFPPLYTWNMAEKEKRWWNQGSRWKNRLKRTDRILMVKGHSRWNYDGHFPMEYRHDFKKVMESYPYTKSIGYTINSLYFNTVLKEHNYYDDSRFFFELPNKDESIIKRKIKGKTFLCYSGAKGDLALTPALKNVIMSKFKIKCRFER